jgi:hypothetical protein
MFPNVVYRAEPYILRPSDEETKAVLEIIDLFRKSLLEVPEPQPFYERYYIGCTPDRVVWAGDDSDAFTEPYPSMLATLEAEDMSDGRFSAISPAGIHGLIFRCAGRRDVVWSLVTAMFWERDRVAKGEDPDVHIPGLHRNLTEFAEGVYAACRATRY